MRLRRPHHIVDRKPKPHKKLYPGVLKLHGLIQNDRMQEIHRLMGIEKRSASQERELQRLLQENDR